jgi:hypothetical protein
MKKVPYNSIVRVEIYMDMTIRPNLATSLIWWLNII